MCKNSIVCQQDHDRAPEIPPSPAAILPPAIPAIPAIPVAKNFQKMHTAARIMYKKYQHTDD